ncbi:MULTISPECIES: hypothetical protein, partial [unclassified Frankia]|uniref:hypothetical protein n=1 Tax=unclassified Frankia TaxID=2632575 RepID=UPI0020252793
LILTRRQLKLSTHQPLLGGLTITMCDLLGIADKLTGNKYFTTGRWGVQMDFTPGDVFSKGEGPRSRLDGIAAAE